MRNIQHALLAVFISLWSPVSIAQQGEVHALSNITETVKEYLVAEATAYDEAAEIEVGRLDSRLRMARCQQPLDAFLPTGSRRLGKITVGVRCEGHKPWTVYVNASIKLMREVVVLAAPVSRNHRITARDLRMEKRDLAKLRSGYLTDPQEALGLQARSPLRAGYVLSHRVLAPPRLVRRGQTVTLLARSGGIEVRSAGKALADGTAGELITVKNLRSSRIVEGIVTEPGVVRVRM